MGFLDRFLKTPNWGVHPEDHKRPAADVPLRLFPTRPAERLQLQNGWSAEAAVVPLVLSCWLARKYSRGS